MMHLEEGRYKIDGVDVLELINQFDSPLYVYSAETMKMQYEKLSDAFPGVKLSLHYACKALSNVNVLKYMKHLGAGLDAVSIQEVY